MRPPSPVLDRAFTLSPLRVKAVQRSCVQAVLPELRRATFLKNRHIVLSHHYKVRSYFVALKHAAGATRPDAEA